MPCIPLSAEGCCIDHRIAGFLARVHTLELPYNASVVRPARRTGSAHRPILDGVLTCCQKLADLLFEVGCSSKSHLKAVRILYN